MEINLTILTDKVFLVGVGTTEHPEPFHPQEREIKEAMTNLSNVVSEIKLFIPSTFFSTV